MKLTTSWIESLLSRTISDREIVDALELAGIEIEQFSSSIVFDRNIVVAKVQKVRQHPQADRLRIAEVFDGTETFEVVCGAPNVRDGLIAPLARVGAVLPAGDIISEAKLRGVVSNGMLCSGRELTLNDDHDGLLELDASLSIGKPLAEVFPADGVIELKTPANRSDVLSVLGLAREVGGQLNIAVKTPFKFEHKFDAKTKYIGSLEDSVQRMCIAELKVDSKLATPEWMTQRLNGAGVRSLGLIVDITNYVMIELGQPLHAYDAANVNLPIDVARAGEKERFMTLDSVERNLSSEDLIVGDAVGTLGLAGVMGGATSEVSESTSRIYLEAATFDAVKIRKSAKRHGLRSEASGRFERGLPVQLAPLALWRAVELMEEHAGGKLIGSEDRLTVFPYEHRIGLRASYASKILGFELTRKEIVETLGRLDIEAKPFDIVAEAKEHLGKPYKWGASFKKCGTDGFDCSYLTDYLYSLIGIEIGHTSLGQFEVGKSVKDAELRPGDILFYRGHDTGDDGSYDLEEIQSQGSQKQPHSIRGFYYLHNHNGGFDKIEAKTPGLVGHNGIFIGNGKVIHAARYELVDDKWRELSEPRVMEIELDRYLLNPTYLGARRYIDDLDDYVSVVQGPWWRTDLRIEEDLIEELARLIGYDKIPATIPAWHPDTVQFDRRVGPERRLRQMLSGLGLYEVMTYSFVSGEQIRRVGDNPKDYLKLKNPLSIDQEYLRRTLTPSHLSVLEQNRKVASEVGFYEISGVFIDRGEDLPTEPTILAVTVASAAEAYRYIKGVWDQVAEQLQLDCRIEVIDSPEYAAGRAAQVMIGGEVLGSIGQMRPAMLREFRIEGEVGRFEVDLDKLLKFAVDRSYVAPSRFPSANRDMTMLVPTETQWQRISKALNNLEGVKAAYGGDYYSDNIPEGYRSLTVRLQLGSPDHTLSDDEVRTLLEKVEATLKNKFKAKFSD